MRFRLPLAVGFSALLLMTGCAGQTASTATPSPVPGPETPSTTLATPTMSIPGSTVSPRPHGKAPVTKVFTPAPMPGCSGTQKYLDADDKEFFGDNTECTQERYWAVMRGPAKEWIIVAWNGENWRLVTIVSTVTQCVGLLADDPDAPREEILALMDGFCDEVE